VQAMPLATLKSLTTSKGTAKYVYF
jgi:hypothetical protein